MYDKIRGVLEAVTADSLIVGTPVFSYKVYSSLTTLSALPQTGADIELLLHAVYKENDITLFGFLSEEEREMFEALISVNKVGPKIALALLSVYAPEQIMYHIVNQNSKELTRAPGLGKRGADMIVAALKDRYKNAALSKQPDGAVEKMRAGDALFSDAVAALTGLGYTWEVASGAVSAAYEDGMSLEALIKRALVSMNG